MDDVRRLDRYELFAASVRKDLADTEARMEDLRSQGRTRTATYQQLFANRSVLRQIIERLADAGL